MQKVGILVFKKGVVDGIVHQPVFNLPRVIFLEALFGRSKVVVVITPFKLFEVRVNSAACVLCTIECLLVAVVISGHIYQCVVGACQLKFYVNEFFKYNVFFKMPNGFCRFQTIRANIATSLIVALCTVNGSSGLFSKLSVHSIEQGG